MDFTNERDELANEAAFGLTEADYEEMAGVFEAMDREDYPDCREGRTVFDLCDDSPCFGE